MSGAARRIDVADAHRLIASRVAGWGSERVPLAVAAGRVLAEPIHAERDQPPFDRVTMDGICVRAAALAAARREFTRAGTQGAGAACIPLGDDAHCVEIMTGAALPPDADTVIPVERIARDGERVTLEPGYEPVPGQFVHRRGSDYRAGDELMQAGQRIGAPEMATLTVSGSADVSVARSPRVAIISTGDELVDVGVPVGEFQVRSSNDRAIEVSLAARGIGPLTRARLPDAPDALLAEIRRLNAAHDVLVLSGGVSMGKYDYVPRILDELGVELVFHKILQRPGLPMWFGVSADGRPVFALPGNPVSSLVCLVRYVLPGLEAAMGAATAGPPRVALGEAVRFEPDLAYFLPVVLRSDGDSASVALPRPTNTSGDFVSLAGTDGFVELPRGRDDYPAGYVAAFYRW